MIIANIVTNSNISVSNEFNVVANIDDIDISLPTLIIGYDYVNKYYPNFDITNIEISTNVYWTFKRTERRDKFEEDFNWFKNKIYIELTKKIDYVFLDPIQLQNKNICKIIKKIYSLDYKIGFIHGEMIYIHGENLVFGIDLSLLNFMGMKIDKIKSKIINVCDVFLEDNKILIEYRKKIGFVANQVRLIPFLYTIINGKNNSPSSLYISRKTGLVS